MTLVKLPERLVGTSPIDAELRSQLQAVRKADNSMSSPNRAAVRAGRNSQIIKREIVLLVQADRRLGMVLILVKQTKELPVIFPIP